MVNETVKPKMYRHSINHAGVSMLNDGLCPLFSRQPYRILDRVFYQCYSRRLSRSLSQRVVIVGGFPFAEA
jgi:hypothetical protein